MSVSNRLSVILSALLGVGAWGSNASGQFVLFGEPNPEAANVEPFERVVHPITQPYFFEDATVTTDVRLWTLYHKFPSSFAGGDAWVFAAQARLAITDKLQLVAYKDGYTIYNSDLGAEDGFNDIAAGLKYQFVSDYEQQFFLAGGLGYEFGLGDADALHNNDEYRAWISANKGFDKLHLGATVNYFYQDGDGQTLGAPGSSQSWSWHLHADYWINEYVSPVVELSGYHWIDRGSAVPVSGIDVTNLGAGGDHILLGVGAEVRPVKDKPDFGIRAAFEVPATFDNDPVSLYGYRLTFSLVYGF